MKKDIIVILKNKSDLLIIQKIIDSYDIPLNIIHGLKTENVCKFLVNYCTPFLLIEANTESECIRIVNDIRIVDKNLVILIYYTNSETTLSSYFNDALSYFIYPTYSQNEIADIFFKILGRQIETINIDDIHTKVRQAILLSLSSQESIIANLLLHGYTVTKISNKQGIAINTVIVLKKRVFEKFNVKSIIEFRILFKETRNIA